MKTDLECPCCDSDVITTSFEDEVIKYGQRERGDYAEITARVPTRRCGDCGAVFTDSDAEEVRDKAVKEHLKRKNDQGD